MTYEQAMAGFRVASAAYAQAQHQLRDQRFYAQNGMANSIGFAEMREYLAHENWLRAHERLVALTPPAEKTAKPQATALAKPATAKPVAPNALPTPALKSTTKASSSLANHFTEECRHSTNAVYARYGLPPVLRS